MDPREERERLEREVAELQRRLEHLRGRRDARAWPALLAAWAAVLALVLFPDLPGGGRAAILVAALVLGAAGWALRGDEERDR